MSCAGADVIWRGHHPPCTNHSLRLTVKAGVAHAGRLQQGRAVQASEVNALQRIP